VPGQVWWSLLRWCNLLKASYLLGGVPASPITGWGAVQQLPMRVNRVNLKQSYHRPDPGGRASPRAAKTFQADRRMRTLDGRMRWVPRTTDRGDAIPPGAGSRGR
jgi:hypothetical protein